jgi:hypothetical protein
LFIFAYNLKTKPMAYSKNPLPKRETIFEIQYRLKQEAKELLKKLKQENNDKNRNSTRTTVTN